MEQVSFTKDLIFIMDKRDVGVNFSDCVFVFSTHHT